MESQAPTARATRLCASTAIVAALCALVVGCHTRVASGPASSLVAAVAPMASNSAFDAASQTAEVPAVADMPAIDPYAEASTITPKDSVAAAD